MSQKKLKPSDGREAELGLKKDLSKEQHRTSLRVLLSYFSSHLPSIEMSLLDPNPAAHSESQRHMPYPINLWDFPTPASSHSLANLLQGLLLLERPVKSWTNWSLTSALLNPQGTREKGKHGQYLSGADSLSKPSFSASSLPALWLTKNDVRHMEVTKSFPCT